MYVHSFCFISNGPTSLFILSVAYKPLLIKQNECSSSNHYIRIPVRTPDSNSAHKISQFRLLCRSNIKKCTKIIVKFQNLKLAKNQIKREKRFFIRYLLVLSEDFIFIMQSLTTSKMRKCQTIKLFQLHKAKTCWTENLLD